FLGVQPARHANAIIAMYKNSKKIPKLRIWPSSLGPRAKEKREFLEFFSLGRPMWTPSSHRTPPLVPLRLSPVRAICCSLLTTLHLSKSVESVLLFVTL